ncbi:MAG: undecaprenyldiphospho-muramoylpentapeptide beta-N-acetylglucosaminyltransferase [Porticoccus sp.]|nr:undecaprenyldiphospho-muramoylpentapeptide beta-N-acetylglucosaminyltransferase [Porticoccus sp.]
MIMAGGTGGHVIPALSVANILKNRNISITWLGTCQGIESELVPASGINIDYIDIEGLRSTKIMKWFKAPYILTKSFLQAVAIIRRESPDIILGLGGFASGPGGVAARIMGLPLVIHEQNSIPGITNKLLAKIATRVLTAFPNTLPRGEWVGNPVRKEICDLSPSSFIGADEPRPPRILILGGSLGAVALNKKIPLALSTIEKKYKPEIRHQSGRANFEETKQSYKNVNLKVSVEKFISNMAEAYDWADMVISRAGALTISELSAAGVGALLIPYPYAVDDHQFYNGQWLVDRDAAYMIREEDLTNSRLVSILNKWLGDPKILISMAKNAKKSSKLDAAELIADICMEAS